ncbi:MAG TPA: hypothetical protein VFK11_03655 [Candidatus Saccharimonadales bacterium]|nr:hypothetical protein [Candidatus Saccharimonadales bacterium]
MNIPERCEGCPRIKPRLEAIERSEARKADFVKATSDFMQVSDELRDEFLPPLEELFEDLSEGLRAEIEKIGKTEEELAGRLAEAIKQGGASRIEKGFELIERNIEVERTCIFILLRGCARGVQQDPAEEGVLDCGSANVDLALDHSISFARSLRPPEQ